MSSIDLSNGKVLKNFLISRMKEGKGKITTKEKVKVFIDPEYGEFVLPEGVEAPKATKKVGEAPKTPDAVDTSTMDIKEMRVAYKVKFDKGVAPRYINDAEWIMNKLAE